MKNYKSFQFLMDGRNSLPAFEWSQKCDYRLQMWCSMLGSDCVECICFGPEKKKVELSDFRRLSMKTYLYRASNLKYTITFLASVS